MSDLINLNKARKAVAKQSQRAQAQQNRVRFGQTKADKAALKLEAVRTAEKLSQTKRET
jgi:hypothetical protein